MNESCRAWGWVVSRTRTSHITHMESHWAMWLKSRVMSRLWMSRVAQSCCAWGWVVSRTRTSHITHMEREKTGRCICLRRLYMNHEHLSHATTRRDLLRSLYITNHYTWAFNSSYEPRHMSHEHLSHARVRTNLLRIAIHVIRMDHELHVSRTTNESRKSLSREGAHKPYFDRHTCDTNGSRTTWVATWLIICSSWLITYSLWLISYSDSWHIVRDSSYVARHELYESRTTNKSRTSTTNMSHKHLLQICHAYYKHVTNFRVLQICHKLPRTTNMSQTSAYYKYVTNFRVLQICHKLPRTTNMSQTSAYYKYVTAIYKCHQHLSHARARHAQEWGISCICERRR